MKIIDLEVTCSDCGCTWQEPIISRHDELQAKITVLRAALEAARRLQHHEENDCWYSCPKSGAACNNAPPDQCTCGADEHNAAIDVALAWTFPTPPSPFPADQEARP